MHARAVKERRYSSEAVRPVPEPFYSSNLASFGEQSKLEESEYLECIRIMTEVLERQRQWDVLDHGTHSARDQLATESDEGDFRELEYDEFYLNTCLLPGRHEPCYSPWALPAHFSKITSSSRGVTEEIEGEPVESDTGFTEAHKLFLAHDLFSEDAQVYNVNDIFDSLQLDPPPVASPVQNKSPDFEGRSVPADHFKALLPKSPIMKQPSDSGQAKKRKITEAGDVTEDRVFRRKYLVTERSEEADPKVSPSSTVPNSGTGEIGTINTPRGNEIDDDEFTPQGIMGLKPESSLENIMEFQSHHVMLKNISLEFEAGFGSDVEYEQRENSKDVGDPFAADGNYEDLYKPGDEVLLKEMGWFPVEEHPNEDNDPSLSVRWIIDEPPSASDLPHLESLLEISPSKFWSTPESESRKRPPVRFGFLCRPESSESSHSIQYFLNDHSPASSPEVTGTMLHHAPSDRISSKKPSHRCSPACPKFCGIAQYILTPARMGGEPMKASMKLTSLDSEGTLAAQVQEGVPETSPDFSEDNPKKNTSSERSMASPVHWHHSHYQETGCVASLTASEKAALRLQRGKNLVTNFLEVGTTQEKVDARLKRNDIEHTDTTVQPSSSLWDQVENATLPSTEMRESCSTGPSTKERENSLLSLELKKFPGRDGTCLVKRDSSLLQPLSEHTDLATGMRNAPREKFASHLLSAKPVSESLSNEHLVTVQCPEVAPDNVAWSGTGVLRVSRKRSSRIRKPKFRGVEVLNRFGNGEVAQPVRTTPNKDYTCRRKSLTPRRSTFEELPTFPRNVNSRHLGSAPTSDCETDLRKIPMQEVTSPAKTPALTRIIKPLRLIKTSTSKGITYVRIKPMLRSAMGKGLPTEPLEVKPHRFVKNSPVKHSAHVNEAVLISATNPGVNGEATQKHEVKESVFSELSGGCEIAKYPAMRSSKYRGVTRHRHTGRYEAHLWDNTRLKLGIAKRGTQVYLGAYPDEDQAAKAHDLAALKYWGPAAYTNFPPSMYEEELRTMKNLTKEQYVAILRRRSPGFTRGLSKYRGVTRHHQEGRWEARIGRHSGAKYNYLGTYDTQEEAAAAYDRAAVRHRGIKAITNFDISNYIKRSPEAQKQ